MAKKLYGTDPDQVPTNADLGTIAYQDKGNLSVGTVDTTGDVGINTASGPTDLTIAHYGHGLGLGYEGATLPSLAGLYTSSSATYGQAYGSLIVKSRTDYAGYSIIFRTQSGEAARFNSAGNLAFPSGKGIDFSASAGSGQTSTLLEDYEEGSWTPSSTSTAFPTAQGRYTKVGRLVYASFYIQVAASINANFFQLSGLPFVNGNSTGGQNLGSMGNTDMGTNQFTFHVAGSGTAILLRNLSNTDWLRYNAYAGKSIWGAVTYTSS